MAIPENGSCLLTSGFDGVLRDGGTENVVKPGNTFEFSLRGGVREDHDIVLVLAGQGKPFRNQRRNDFAGEIVDTDDFPHGVFGAEELIANGAAHNADIGGTVDIVLREDRALIHEPPFDVKEFRRDAAIDGVPVLIGIDDLDGIVDVRRYALDEGDLVLNGDSICLDERLGIVRSRAHAVDGAAARFDPDEVVSQVVEVLFDAGLPGFANGDNANDGGNPD